MPCNLGFAMRAAGLVCLGLFLAGRSESLGETGWTGEGGQQRELRRRAEQLRSPHVDPELEFRVWQGSTGLEGRALPVWLCLGGCRAGAKG